MRTYTVQAVNRFRRLKGSLVGAVAAGLVLLGVADAFALPVGMRMRIEELTTGTGVVITDGVIGSDADGLANGVTNYPGAIPGFPPNITTGTSKPAVPTTPGFFSEIDLNSININGDGPGTLRITLEDDGFTNGIGLAGLKFVSSASGTVTGGVTVAVNTWFNTANTVPALGPNVGPVAGPVAAIGPIPGSATPGLGVGGFTFNPGTPNPTSYAVNGDILFSSATAYSMFTQVEFDFTIGGTSQFTSSAVVVPEPATLTLFGVGLVGMIVGIGRKRR